MRKEFKKSFLNKLKKNNAELLQIKKEIDLLLDRKKELEERTQDLNNILSIAPTKAEGETVSYKIGRVILEAKTLRGFFSLPSSLLSVYRYKKTLDTLSISTVINTPEPRKIDQVSKKLGNKIKASATKKNPVVNNVLLTLLDRYGALDLSNIYNSFDLLPKFEGQVLNSKAFAFLFDSQWNSKNSDWDYSLVSRDFSNFQGSRLEKAFCTLQDRGIPIVFYYKHDQQYLDIFKPLLKYVDYFITNNASSKKEVQGEFKASVHISGIVDSTVFNIINSEGKEKSSKLVCFLDYNKSFVNNIVNSKIRLFEEIQEDVVIYKKKSIHTILPVPILELSNEIEPQEYADIFKKHKFSFYIANPTEQHISQEIIDSLASGTPVISTSSNYLENAYPELIQFANTKSEINKILATYEDKWAYAHLVHKGYREITKNFHVENLKNVLNQYILKKIPEKAMVVSIVMATMREKYIDRVLDNLKRQNYEHKEIIFVTQNFSSEGVIKLKKGLSKLTGYFSTKVIEDNTDITLGERLNLAAKFAVGDYIAKMDDDDFYFENYLSDMILPFKCGIYDVVGKAENFVYLEGMNQTVLLREGRAANREMEFVAGPTLVIKRSIFDKLEGFLPLNRGEDSTLIKRVLEQGGKVYSSDPFNFIQFRSSDVTAHTWQQKVEAFAKSGTYIADGMATNIVRV